MKFYQLNEGFDGHPHLKSNPILHHFPIYLNKTCWASVNAECEICHSVIEHQNLRGEVGMIGSSTASIRAAAICHVCDHVSDFSCRLHEDMSTSMLVDGEWIKSGKPNVSLWESIKEYFSGILH